MRGRPRLLPFASHGDANMRMCYSNQELVLGHVEDATRVSCRWHTAHTAVLSCVPLPYHAGAAPVAIFWTLLLSGGHCAKILRQQSSVLPRAVRGAVGRMYLPGSFSCAGICRMPRNCSMSDDCCVCAPRTLSLSDLCPTQA